ACGLDQFGDAFEHGARSGDVEFGRGGGPHRGVPLGPNGGQILPELARSPGYEHGEAAHPITSSATTTRVRPRDAGRAGTAPDTTPAQHQHNTGTTPVPHRFFSGSHHARLSAYHRTVSASPVSKSMRGR